MNLRNVWLWITNSDDRKARRQARRAALNDVGHGRQEYGQERDR